MVTVPIIFILWLQLTYDQNAPTCKILQISKYAILFYKYFQLNNCTRIKDKKIVKMSSFATARNVKQVSLQ